MINGVALVTIPEEVLNHSHPLWINYVVGFCIGDTHLISAIFWISVGSYKLHLAESDRSGKLKLEKRYQDKRIRFIIQNLRITEEGETKSTHMVWFGLVVNGSDDDQLLLRFKSIPKGTQAQYRDSKTKLRIDDTGDDSHRPKEQRRDERENDECPIRDSFFLPLIKRRRDVPYEKARSLRIKKEFGGVDVDALYGEVSHCVELLVSMLCVGVDVLFWCHSCVLVLMYLVKYFRDVED
ncbi:hypothetical protein DY000_02034667 [Brassica cretica]|uniref:Uncharacterized protein n=1 Tax=Brassica cretica TaxID=69181 RepID=A0ABQ7DGA0_BRACR|nr:hypothetical protein DY000_02034667 [Brassica cretica]